MRRKSLAIVFSLLVILNAVTVSAQLTDSVKSSLGMALGMLADLITLLRAAVYLKVMIWILVFALMNWGAKTIKMDPKTANIVSLIVSLMSVVLIPEGIITYIALQYSFVVVLILLLLPVIIGVLLQKYVGDNKLIRFLLFVVLGTLMIASAKAVEQEKFSDLGISTDVAGWLYMCGAYYFLVAIIGFFSLGGPLFGSGITNGWNKFTGLFKRDGTPREPTPTRGQTQRTAAQAAQGGGQGAPELTPLLENINNSLMHLQTATLDVKAQGKVFLDAMRQAYQDQTHQVPNTGSVMPPGFVFPTNEWNGYVNASNTARGRVHECTQALQAFATSPFFVGASQQQSDAFYQQNTEFAEGCRQLMNLHQEINKRKLRWQTI